MGEFIDYGEPEDFEGSLIEILRKYPSNFRVEEEDYPEIYESYLNGNSDIYETPWEEFQKIKDAIYSTKLADRSLKKLFKHNWIVERSKEIKRIRKSCYKISLHKLSQL